MKKIASILMMAVMLCVVASCGGSSPKDVVEKYKAGEELTTADYDVAFNYIKDAGKEVMSMMKNSNGNYAEMAQKAQELEKKYQYVEEMSKILNKAPKDYQEQKKQELINEFGDDFKEMGINL